LTSNSEDICWGFPSTTYLLRSDSEVQVVPDAAAKDIDTLTLDDLEKDNGERIEFMVHVKDGVYITYNILFRS